MKIKKIPQLLNEQFLRITIALFAFFDSIHVFADGSIQDPTISSNNLGNVATKLTTEATQWKTFLWSGSQVAGIIIAIAGINMWVKAAKNEDRHNSHSKAILITIIGSLMFFLPTFMGLGASSILSSSGGSAG